MSHSGRKILSNTIYLYIRLLISLVIGIVTSRILLSVLGFEDYGLFSLVGGFIAFLTIFTGLFAVTASRFIAYEIGREDEYRLKQTCSTIINIIVIASIFIFIIGAAIGIIIIKNRLLNIPEDRINVGVFVYICALIVFVLNFISVPYQAIIIAREKMNFYALMGIVDSLLKLGVVISLQFFNTDRLYYYTGLLAVVSLVTRIMYGRYCVRNFVESKWTWNINKDVAKNMGSFSLWMGVGSAAGTFKDQGTTILLNLFFGLILNAVMGIVMQVNSLINSFTSNIGMAIAPQITKSYSSGDIERSKLLTMISAKAHGFLILIIMIPFLLDTEYILDIWLKSYPPQTPVFVRWSLCVCFVTGISNAYIPLFLAVGRIKIVQVLGSALCLAYVCLCYVCFKLGYPAITSMQLLLIIMTICMLIGFYSLKISVAFPFMKFIIKVIVPYIAIGAIGTLIAAFFQTFFETPLIRLTTCFVSSSIVVCLLTTILVLDHKERMILNEILIKKLRR